MSHEVRKLDLDLYMVGELDQATTGELESHLASCPDCRAYLTELRNENEKIAAKYPYGLFKQIAERKSRRPATKLLATITRPAWAPVYLAALIAMIVIPTQIMNRHSSDIVYKGESGISLLLRRGGQVTPATDSEMFRAGDEIQVLFDAKKDSYFALVSVDARGTISWYQPDPTSAVCTIPVKKGGGQTYPTSIRLDDSPGYELVLGIFCDRAMTSEQLRKTIARAVDDSVPADRMPAHLRSTAPQDIASVSAKILRKENGR